MSPHVILIGSSHCLPLALLPCVATTSHMTTYLDNILASKRATAARDHRPLLDLMRAAENAPPARGFAEALRAASAERLAVISEIKRRSPSKGELAAKVDPTKVAAAYAAGGAACLSVLTDSEFFGGSPSDLMAARLGAKVPALRKDFTVTLKDVCDARIMGADCVLFIVAALTDAELAEFDAFARHLGIDALVEVHDEIELERALEHTSSALVGVNQRDLVTFSVDHERAVRVAGAIPSDRLAVAESGVRGAEDARALAAAGFAAVLVGEHLMVADDPAAAVAALRVPRRG